MPIPLSCQQCGRNLRVKDELAGMQIYCPDCKGVLTVPRADDAFRPDPEPLLEVVAAEPPKDDPYAERYQEPAPAKKLPIPMMDDDDEWDDDPPPKRVAPTRPSGPSVGAMIGGLALIVLAIIVLVGGLAIGILPIRLIIILFIVGAVTFGKGISSRS